MPIYPYACARCKVTFDRFLAIIEYTRFAPCPLCKSPCPRDWPESRFATPVREKEVPRRQPTAYLRDVVSANNDGYGIVTDGGYYVGENVRTYGNKQGGWRNEGGEIDLYGDSLLA